MLMLALQLRTKVTARMHGWGMAMDWRRGRAEVGILRMYMHGCMHNFVYCLTTAPALEVSSRLVSRRYRCMHVHGSFRSVEELYISIGAGYILNSLSYHMHARTFPSIIGLERECQCKTCNNDRERTPRPSPGPFNVQQLASGSTLCIALVLLAFQPHPTTFQTHASS